MLIVDLQKEAVPTSRVKHGHAVVGLTAVPISALASPLLKGVLVRAPGATDPVPNTKPVWIGSHNVTADSNATTGGMLILPGGSMYITVDDISELYAVSTSASQDLAWMGI